MADASFDEPAQERPGLPPHDGPAEPAERQPTPERLTVDAEDSASAVWAVVQQLGGVLLSAETVETAVQLVTEVAVRTIPGSTGAGVTLIDDRGKRSTAASNRLVEQADRLQYEFDSGPCLTAWREQTLVRVDDVAAESRWPQWTAAVGSLGVASVLSAPLVAGGEPLGAIKVYADRPNSYDASSEELLRLFARQAAILLANTQAVAGARQLTARLTEALRSRTLVAQACGVVMARGAADPQEAFGLLVAAAERSNLPVHEVARRLLASVTDDGGGRAGSNRPTP